LPSNHEQINEKLKFINECQASIFDVTMDNNNMNNNIILKKTDNIIKKKYKLYQYNLYVYCDMPPLVCDLPTHNLGSPIWHQL
jgi:hypothetical protein